MAEGNENNSEAEDPESVVKDVKPINHQVEISSFRSNVSGLRALGSGYFT